MGAGGRHHPSDDRAVRTPELNFVELRSCEVRRRYPRRSSQKLPQGSWSNNDHPGLCAEAREVTSVQQPCSNPSESAGILQSPEIPSKLSCCLRTAEVAGSNPASPTLKKRLFAGRTWSGRNTSSVRQSPVTPVVHRYNSPEGSAWMLVCPVPNAVVYSMMLGDPGGTPAWNWLGSSVLDRHRLVSHRTQCRGVAQPAVL